VKDSADIAKLAKVQNQSALIIATSAKGIHPLRLSFVALKKRLQMRVKDGSPLP
jgi:hypothetical protein